MYAAYAQPGADGRLHAPSFERNHGPIRDALVARLAGLTGRALEVGSGSGQHIGVWAEALPRLDWTPSDPLARHRASIDAWTQVTGRRVAPARDLDVTGDWSAVADLIPLSLIICLNVIHIAPWRVAECLIGGAGRALGPDGVLVLYGPYIVEGRHTGEGNVAFDARLRAENPEWGLRDTADVAALAREAGFAAPEILPMPSDNRLLIFRRKG
ncbi:MAG: DUF938 domain-containing protein [Alphaproteobacteria bacterium]|nr:MAG: DUF938 domain-containing protein [Alphaproteobacteria bacterium]